MAPEKIERLLSIPPGVFVSVVQGEPPANAARIEAIVAA